jgi:amino acid adenylation domain-containing protein
VYLMFTSGSTGFPRAVMIEEGALFNLRHALSAALGEAPSGAGRRVSLNAPLFFDAAVKQLVQLATGATLYLVPEEVRRDPVALVRWLEAEQLEVLDTTPAQLKQLLAAGLGAAGHWTPAVALIGGEALEAQSWRALAGLPQMRSYNVYGPTECTVDATACRIEAQAGRVVIGKPLSNVRLYVLDEEQEPVAVGMRGELYIGGAGVGRGYAGEPGLTVERFVADAFGGEAGARLYRTGDEVRWLAEGEVEYLGRVDEQVKVRGYRVELGEIAAVLREHEGVREAVVVARGQGEEVRLIGYVVGHAGASAAEPA